MLQAWLRLATLGCVCIVFSGCGAREPFKHTSISGKVTYDDGTLIPVEKLQLTFIPQSAPVDSKTHPRPGRVIVDKQTGTFNSATTHKANDGLVCGKHKVTLSSALNAPLLPSVIPPEYLDPVTTPLEIDTAQQPFVLSIRKPNGPARR